MEKQKVGLKPFFSLILSTKIPKLALIIGLTASVYNACWFGCPVVNEKFSGWFFSRFVKCPD